MARTVNKLILVGHVARDPERHDRNRVVHLTLATTRREARDDGFEERTEHHHLELEGRLAEIAHEYVRKGDRLYLEGRLEYEMSELNGVQVPVATIRVRELVMLGTGYGNGDTSRGSWERELAAEATS